MPEDTTASSRRVLAFCWDNPSSISQYKALFEAMAEGGPLEVCVVTTGPEARLRFSAMGYTALSIRNLMDDLPENVLHPVSEESVREYCRYDMLIGTLRPAPANRPAGDDREAGMLACGQGVVDIYTEIFNWFRPTAVLVWNGAMLFQKVLAELARERSIPVFFLERGLLPGTLSVDPEGVNFASHMAGDKWRSLDIPSPSPAEVRRVDEECTSIAGAGKTIVSRGKRIDPAPLRQSLQIPARSKVLLFPLQIERDTNILEYSPHFKTMPEIIRAAQDALPEGTCLVVKPHPEDKDRLEELAKCCGPNARLSIDADLPSLLNLADVVMTVNSTTGLEALTWRKPVVVLGNALYSQKGFTHDLESPDNLPETLRAAFAQDQFPAEAFARFYVYLRRNYLFELEGGDFWGSRARVREMGNGNWEMDEEPASALIDGALRRYAEFVGRVKDGAPSIVILGELPEWFREWCLTMNPRAQVASLVPRNALWRGAMMRTKGCDLLVALRGLPQDNTALRLLTGGQQTTVLK